MQRSPPCIHGGLLNDLSPHAFSHAGATGNSQATPMSGHFLLAGVVYVSIGIEIPPQNADLCERTIPILTDMTFVTLITLPL